MWKRSRASTARVGALGVVARLSVSARTDGGEALASLPWFAGYLLTDNAIGLVTVEQSTIAPPGALLSFGDLFADVVFFDIQGKRPAGSERLRFVAIERLGAKNLYAYARPIGYALSASNREDEWGTRLSGGYRDHSFAVIEWADGRAVVICRNVSHISSTWVGYIDPSTVLAVNRD